MGIEIPQVSWQSTRLLLLFVGSYFRPDLPLLHRQQDTVMGYQERISTTVRVMICVTAESRAYKLAKGLLSELKYIGIVLIRMKRC